MNSGCLISKTADVCNNRADFDELIAEYEPLVRRIACHLMGRLPTSIQQDDLVQAGMTGLLEALRGYDDARGASLETYARIRIRGAMLDEVRRCDWTPRSVYRKSRQLSGAIREVEDRLGRDARDSEIAASLGIDMDEYISLVKDAAGYQVVSYETITELDGSRDEVSLAENNGPARVLQEGAFRLALAENIADLPQREQLVMSLYYVEEFNMREIGEILGVTEGRICQIHGQALLRLRSRMSDWAGNN